MEDYETEIAELEAERTAISERWAVLIANRNNIQDELNRLTKRQIGVSRNIHGILRDEISRQDKGK